MALEITEVSPSTITELTDTWINVSGKGFLGGITWFLFGTPNQVDEKQKFTSLGNVTVNGDTSVSILIPALPPGFYSLKAKSSSEEFSLAKAFTVVASTTDELYNYIIGPIREDDRLEGREFLKRYMSAPQALVDQMRQKIFSLPFSTGAYSIDEDMLPQLAKLVAFGEPDLSPIINGLSTAGKRKLIASATTLWSQQGTESGYRNACRIVSGKELGIFNWFDSRSLCADKDTCFIGFSRRTGGGLKFWPDSYVYPDKLGTAPAYIIDPVEIEQYYHDYEQSGPYQTDLILYYPFATDEEQDIIYHILRLMRPSNERLYVYFDEFFEDWKYGISDSLWESSPYVEDEGNGWIKVNSNQPGADAGLFLIDDSIKDKGIWELFTTRNQFTFLSTVKFALPKLSLHLGNPAAREYTNIFGQSGKGHYAVRFYKTNNSGREANVDLMRILSDGSKIILTSTKFTITANKEYCIQLNADFLDNGITKSWYLQVLIDNEFVLSASDSVNPLEFDLSSSFVYISPYFIEPASHVDLSAYNSYLSTVDVFKRPRTMSKIGINR